MAAASAAKTPRKTASRPRKAAAPAPPEPGPPVWAPAPEPAPTWQPAPAAPPPAGQMDDRQYGLLLHLSALGGLVVGFFFLGPLILWLVRKDQSPFIDRHGREATNFHLSMLLYVVAGFVLYLVLTVATFGIGGLLLIPFLILGIFAYYILSIVFAILAAVQANQGREYRFPITIRFIGPPQAAYIPQ